MIYGILIEGLIYGIMALGIFVSFRVINFCDMTVDGAFPLGGCILAACLLRGVSPVFRRRFRWIDYDDYLYALSHTRSARGHPRHDDALFGQSPSHVEPREHIVFAHRNDIFEKRCMDGARLSRTPP